MADPKVGTVKDGYRFKGGSPANPSNWQKLPPQKGEFQNGYEFLGGNPADPKSWRKNEENLLEKIPVVGGFLAGAADIPLNLVSGLASTGKSVTDAFGANNVASEVFESIRDYAESLTSAQSREDEKTVAAIQKEAEGKGIWEEVKAAARAFTVNPLDTAASLVGSAAPFAAAAALTGGPGMLALGTASGVGTVKGSISDAVYARALEAGVPEEQAKIMADEAQAYGGENLDMIALGGVLGAVASATGFDKQLGRVIARRAVADAIEEGVEQQATRGAIRRGVTGFGAEALPEAGQAGQERFAQNIAQQRAGYETDLMAGVAGQAAFEGLAGGILGGVAGMAERGAPRPIATEEELLSEREELEAEIAASDIPEAQDPEVRAIAAEYMQLGNSLDEAVATAAYELEEFRARAKKAEEKSAAREPDVGGGEPDVSGVGEPDAVAEPAGPPADVGRGPVGGVSVPTGQPAPSEGVVEPTLVQPTPAQVKATVPDIEKVFEDNVFDFEDTYGVTKLNAEQKKQAARIVIQSPEVDPYDAINDVLKRGQVLRGETKKAPTLEAGEAPGTFRTTTTINGVEQVAEGPVSRPVVEEAAPVAPAPVVEEVIPSTVELPPLEQIAGLKDGVERARAIKAYIADLQSQGEGWDNLRRVQDAIDEYRALSEPRRAEARARKEARKAVAAEEAVLSDIETQIAEATPTPIVEKPVTPPAEEATPITVEETVKVAEINPSLPEDVQAAQAEVNEFNPGFEIRYNEENGRRRYSYGVVGGKVEFASPNLNSVKNRILNQKPLQPKQVIEGVPVKQMPPGKAGGLEQKPVKTEPDPIGPANAGKLTPAQQEQIDLLKFEIDAARKEQQINDAQRSELVNMLRTPSPEEMDIFRSGLSDQEKVKRRALRSTWNPTVRIQNEIDKLTAQGRALRTEEKLLEADEKMPAAAKKAKQNAFKKQAADIAKRTKEQSKLLVEAKAGIYKAVRDKLAQAKRKPLIQKAALKKQLAEGKINKQQFDRMVRDLKPEPYMFRKGKGKAAGITLEELNAAIKDITSRWGARLEPKAVQSVTDLPPAIRKEIEELDRTDAFGFYKDGKAYLIADNMNGVEDVAPTLYHEALGHLGLRQRFQDGLDAVLTDIHRTNPRVRQLADKWLNANQDLYTPEENPLARAVEEVLASASENGPLSAGRFDKLVNFLKDFARKYLGIDLKFSNREVRTLLAMAHEQVLSGKGTVMGSSSMMFNSPQQEETKSTVADSETGIEDAIEKVATTTTDQMDVESSSRGMLGNIGAALKSKSSKNWFSGFRLKNFDRGWISRGGLDAMPTDGALDLANTVLGINPTTAALRKAVDAAERMNGARATTRRRLNRIVTDLKEYMLSNADSMLFQGKKRKALPVAMDYGNYYNIDMVKFTEATTREEAFKTDQVWNKYNKLLQNPDLNAKNKADFEAKLKKREDEIEGGMRIWSNLSKDGRTLYKRVRDMNRKMYTRRQYLMQKRVESLKDAGLPDEAVSSMMASIRAEQERLNDMVNAPDKGEAHKDYPEVPLGLFHREYFPKRRYGNYWLRVKKTKFGEPILRFYETKAELNEDLNAFAEEMGIDPNSDGSSNYLQTGNDVETQLGDDFDPENAIIKAIKLVSDIDPKTFTEGKKAKLRGDIYQLLLQGTPEGTGRKQFIKSKNRLGWSSDILRTTGVTAEEFASDSARLQYVPEIDRALNEAKSSFEAKPNVGDGEQSISTSQQGLARYFTTNIEKRINGDMEPAPNGFVNKIVPWANQLAYISFLTAPATALVQVTALPIRVAPNLWGKYGMAATTKAMGRYMNVFNNLPRRESKSKDARKTFRIPTLMESAKVKGSKRHQDALSRATDEYGLIMPLSEFTMGEARTPETAAKGRLTEIRQKAYDATTFLFDASEQLTREVAFMATYDLEYDKLADAGLSPEERQTRAIIAAKDVVNYTLGNYSNLNRPPIMKGSELARALFLFKQYSVITTRFFVQATRAIFGGDTPRAERVAAMKEMTGVLGMSFLMGGVVALPLYTLGMAVLQALQDATDDEEDRKERMKQNPITADSVELQFRYDWLPSHFSQPMVTDDKGKKITLGDIILNGAVSEATGWNFGSRVSLDLVGMWFRAPKDADTWTQTINNALVENIPGASASLNIVSMGEEVAKGNVLKGLELGLPAMLKAPLKAYRLETEGLRTQTEKIKLKQDEFSNYEIIGAVLGFNPTQVAKLQQENRDVLGRYRDLRDKKSELLSDYKRAVRRIQNGDADGQEEAKKAFDAIKEYNRKVGNPYFGISYANIYKSLSGAEAEGRYDIQGMGLNEVESYYAQKMIGEK